MIRRKILYLIGIIFIASSCIEEPQKHSNTKEGNFNALWDIVDTHYCFFEYKNIDWNQIYREYHKQLEDIDENDQYKLFDLLAEMLAELKDGHVNLYSDFNISSYDKFYKDSAANYYSSIISSDEYLGSEYKKTGGFIYEKLKKNDEIGYIYYGSFVKEINDSHIKEIFNHFKNCKGLIIDVRNNGGGDENKAEQLVSYFITKKTLVGYMQLKNGPGHSDFSKAAPIYVSPHDSIHWDKPVTVLTNRSSYSATNTFTSQIRQAPQAVTIGSWSGGGGGVPFSSELPNGWRVRLSTSLVYDTNMNHIENGIAPDIHVVISEEDKENNRDVVIDKAIETILNSSN